MISLPVAARTPRTLHISAAMMMVNLEQVSVRLSAYIAESPPSWFLGDQNDPAILLFASGRWRAAVIGSGSEHAWTLETVAASLLQDCQHAIGL